MTGTAIEPAQDQMLEQVLVTGDLSKLSVEQRLSYYLKVCETTGLNPLSRPFDYIMLNNRLTLYARKDCTDQLRRRDNISVQIVGREQTGDIYVVTARAITGQGRTDESIGAVSIGGLRGEAAANAIMKSETKAKRRVTLSICGLGVLDESELDGIPHTQPESVAAVPNRPGLPAGVNVQTGELPRIRRRPPNNVPAAMAAVPDEKRRDLKYRFEVLGPDAQQWMTEQKNAQHVPNVGSPELTPEHVEMIETWLDMAEKGLSGDQQETAN